jgi:hypothetical protein
MAGRGLVSEFSQLPGKAPVTPGIVFFSQADNQGLGVGILAWASRLGRLIIEGPFLLFLASVPGQEGFGLGDGNDLGQPILNP